ncbi:TAXI family TRAP transporter solute-binding subunit [Granulicoccus phenolivorans]|uniref:TAXI family TRAP transporter solute-binding subunit n=1 Tax=Granulicoccus phenolivorans TaxID=266854 RepID=UPI00040DBC72|nr:TAXI family TRAP transporter solute-binding subunit [Granulicoccus phenolivorans]
MSISRRGILLGLAALPLIGCTQSAQPEPLRLAAGEAGGPYLEFGTLLSAALRAHGGAQLQALPSDGSIHNLRLLEAGSVELALAQADAASDLGRGAVAIGRVYQNYLQCVVRADSGLRRLAELAGRRVSVGAPESGGALTTRRILEAAGLTTGPQAPTLSERGLAGGAAALAAGDVDAFFWAGGVPTARIADLAATGTPVALLDLGTTFAALNAAHPDRYLATEVPAGAYGSRAPVPTIGVPNLLLARPDLPDPVARTLVDVLIDDAEALVPAGSAGLQYLSRAGLIDTAPVPLHPAALQRYRERYG